MTTGHQDTYFIDRHRALRVALEQNRVILESGEEAVQLCYYDGEPLSHAPPNLVNVPLVHLLRFFDEHPLRLPGRFECGGLDLPPEVRAALQQAFDEAVSTLRAHREAVAASGIRPFAEDTYYIDPVVAYQCALLQQQVNLGHRSVFGRQLCYYDGEPLADAPDNLIPLPARDFVPRLTVTRYRRPTRIALPIATPEPRRRDIEQGFAALNAQVAANRQALFEELTERCRTRAVDDFQGPLRVFLPASRVTEVMQYSSRGLARAFEKLGHRPLLSIEHNDLEGLDRVNQLDAFLQLGPHLVVDINHQDNFFLHPSVFNAVWYQDPMPEIVHNRDLLPWRERDLVYSFSPRIDGYLRRTGARDIRRQRFCIDGEVFRERPEIPREEKIVFVGSAYASRLRDSAAERDLIDRLETAFAQGQRFSITEIEALAEAHGVDGRRALWDLFHYVVRDTTVRWMCETAPIPVEVYGRGWEIYPQVVPFFKGPLPHGEPVARVYNSARFALVTHPFEVHSQRLAEAAGCGCIPVVYDARHVTDAPYWEDQCLFFHSRETLRAAFARRPRRPPREIARESTYEAFARSLVTEVRRRARGT